VGGVGEKLYRECSHLRALNQELPQDVLVFSATYINTIYPDALTEEKQQRFLYFFYFIDVNITR
jgi:hypothetical protein